MIETETTKVPIDADKVLGLTRQLSGMVIDATMRGEIPMITKMAAIPRGGMIIGGLIAQQLDLRAEEILSIPIGTYDKDEQTKKGSGTTYGQMPSREDVENEVVLVVDDVHEDGDSIEEAKRILYSLGAKLVLTATLHYKPKEGKVVAPPDFYVESTLDWLVYYWESENEAVAEEYRKKRKEFLAARGTSQAA